VAELADRLAAGLLAMDEQLDREFEARLVDSSALAFRVAFSVLRHREDAEDVAQDALVKAYRRRPQLREPKRFRGWLVRLTWRLAIDRQQAVRRQLAREGAAAEQQRVTTMPARHSADERAAQLWAAIDRLPEKLRVVIVLAAIEGHDIEALASLLGLPVGTVKSRLFLARQRLKDALQ
jgi:RNA polymerase sigma-70 factor (ECF subfamily)